MQKTIQCKMNGHLTELPCSASGCPMFGDCLVEYEKAQKKPMTKADLIRAMSDEDLAKMFMDFGKWLLVGYGLDAEVKSTERVLEWLKQPAEEVRG